MSWRTWNKMLAISFLLSAAGIVTCVGALLDVLVPAGSAWDFVIWTAVLGAAIILVVGGYVWVCDKCEDYLSGYTDRRLSRQQEKLDRAASKEESGKDSLGANDVGPQYPVDQFRRRAALRVRDVESLRYALRSMARCPEVMFMRKHWRGQ
jgi:hypothetical protein